MQYIKFIIFAHFFISKILLLIIIVIVLLIVVIICYYVIKHPKNKRTYYHIDNIKMASNNELKEIGI